VLEKKRLFLSDQILQETKCGLNTLPDYAFDHDTPWTDLLSKQDMMNSETPTRRRALLEELLPKIAKHANSRLGELFRRVWLII
jgi:hypothetical protein